MQRGSFFRRAIFVLVIILLFISTRVVSQPNSLPQAVVEAHSMFIENETGFAELQYTAILELSKWGRFDIVENREKADLVMVLSSGTHVRAIPDGQYPRPTGLNAFTEDAVPKGHTRIALVDPKTGAMLWSDLHKTEGGKVKSGHLLDGLRGAFDGYEKGRNPK